jgi:hypothetical protein
MQAVQVGLRSEQWCANRLANAALRRADRDTDMLEAAVLTTRR